jgi:hypothetical protein
MGKPEGKRPLARPRRRWENGIKMQWSGFSWLRTGTSDGLLWTRWWTFGFWCHGVVIWRFFWTREKRYTQMKHVFFVCSLVIKKLIGFTQSFHVVIKWSCDWIYKRSTESFRCGKKKEEITWILHSLWRFVIFVYIANCINFRWLLNTM